MARQVHWVAALPGRWVRHLSLQDGQTQVESDPELWNCCQDRKTPGSVKNHQKATDLTDLMRWISDNPSTEQHTILLAWTRAIGSFILSPAIWGRAYSFHTRSKLPAEVCNINKQLVGKLTACSYREGLYNRKEGRERAPVPGELEGTTGEGGRTMPGDPPVGPAGGVSVGGGTPAAGGTTAGGAPPGGNAAGGTCPAGAIAGGGDPSAGGAAAGGVPPDGGGPPTTTASSGACIVGEVTHTHCCMVLIWWWASAQAVVNLNHEEFNPWKYQRVRWNTWHLRAWQS